MSLRAGKYGNYGPAYWKMFENSTVPMNMAGSGFFGDVGRFFKNAGNKFVETIKKPSTILGGLSMLPTPFSPILKVGSVVSGLTGHGKRRKRRVAKKKAAPKKKVGAGKRKRVAKRK